MAAYGAAAQPDGRGGGGSVERRREMTPSGPTWAGAGKSLEKKTGCPRGLGQKGTWAPKIEFKIKQGFGD
jgi:hypothetical protein